MDISNKDQVVSRFRMEVDTITYQHIRDLWKHHAVSEDARDVAGILSTLTDDCRYEVVNTAYVWNGRSGAAQFYQELLGAIPDAKFELQHIVIGPQGVFEEALLTGHHRGDFRSYRASNRTVQTRVGIFFPWDETSKLFSGERVYADLNAIFGA